MQIGEADLSPPPSLGLHTFREDRSQRHVQPLRRAAFEAEPIRERGAGRGHGKVHPSQRDALDQRRDQFENACPWTGKALRSKNCPISPLRLVAAAGAATPSHAAHAIAATAVHLCTVLTKGPLAFAQAGAAVNPLH